MSRYVDLSVPIATGMPVYPGDPEVELSPAATVSADGCNVLGLRLGSHTGTHVDAPYHVDDRLPTLDELPFDRFVGPAVVVDARDAGPRAALGRRAVQRGGTVGDVGQREPGALLSHAVPPGEPFDAVDGRAARRLDEGEQVEGEPLGRLKVEFGLGRLAVAGLDGHRQGEPDARAGFLPKLGVHLAAVERRGVRTRDPDVLDVVDVLTGAPVRARRGGGRRGEGPGLGGANHAEQEHREQGDEGVNKLTHRGHLLVRAVGDPGLPGVPAPGRPFCARRSPSRSYSKILRSRPFGRDLVFPGQACRSSHA